jgi:hypothetical protein
MYAGKRTSWVKDTGALGIQAAWVAQYRDVVVLDAFNKPAGAYSLNPPQTLQDQVHRDAMKAMIVAAATPADTDNDKLPDFWEMNTYGDLIRNGASADAGGITVLQRYAHCTISAMDVQPRIFSLPDGSVSVLYNRRRGTAFGLTVLPEFSRTLSGWDTVGHGWEEWSLRTQYDGSCSEIVEWKILTPGEWRFGRIRSTLP